MKTKPIATSRTVELKSPMVPPGGADRSWQRKVVSSRRRREQSSAHEGTAAGSYGRLLIHYLGKHKPCDPAFMKSRLLQKRAPQRRTLVSAEESGGPSECLRLMSSRGYSERRCARNPAR